jgi:adenine-specific DNA-methyltransferase
VNGLTIQRQFGSYYTPLKISQILCDWAIRSKSDQILESGFGGCGLLEASKQRLQSLGCVQPNRYIYGCDKDKKAFEYLAAKIGPVKLDKRFCSGQL